MFWAFFFSSLNSENLSEVLLCLLKWHHSSIGSDEFKHSGLNCLVVTPKANQISCKMYEILEYKWVERKFELSRRKKLYSPRFKLSRWADNSQKVLAYNFKGFSWKTWYYSQSQAISQRHFHVKKNLIRQAKKRRICVFLPCHRYERCFHVIFSLNVFKVQSWLISIVGSALMSWH